MEVCPNATAGAFASEFLVCTMPEASQGHAADGVSPSTPCVVPFMQVRVADDCALVHWTRPRCLTGPVCLPAERHLLHQRLCKQPWRGQ